MKERRTTGLSAMMELLMMYYFISFCIFVVMIVVIVINSNRLSRYGYGREERKIHRKQLAQFIYYTVMQLVKIP
ncbi:hypothetical protein PENTCL1PPCAC_23067 [Pristionchus entomophagus]|uniref:G protein-coupled receptor n=1 Tax=Pristionchus entomophagus TaxID=358040 RepID=A0AAV5U3C2_9BILA|nr:hypothetical protein PENTCL1PPCAC_23067 [Pristionchus entomophagus]